MASIRAIIFDFFGVLASYEDQLVYDRIAPFCSDPAAANVAMQDIVSDPRLITAQQGVRDIHAALVRDLGLSMSYEAFLRAWLEPYSKPMPGMATLIHQLAGRYRLILLSNVDSEYWQTILTLHPELGLFDSLLISFELRLAKPDPAIFRHACETAGATPDECFFVDDKLGNVEAALALGLQTHWFRNTEDLRQELVRLGLL